MPETCDLLGPLQARLALLQRYYDLVSFNGPAYPVGQLGELRSGRPPFCRYESAPSFNASITTSSLPFPVKRMNGMSFPDLSERPEEGQPVHFWHHVIGYYDVYAALGTLFRPARALVAVSRTMSLWASRNSLASSSKDSSSST